MNRTVYLRSKTVSGLRNRKLRLRSAPLALAGFAALAFASGTLKAQTANNSSEISPGLLAILAEGRSGPNLSARASLPLQVGFARGGTALYITPEVGVDAPPGSDLYNTALAVAQGFNANFIPVNFASLPNTLPSFTPLPANTPVRDIYVFSTQGNVLSATPTPAGPNDTNANYSPLWQVSLVAWNPGFTPTTLTSTAAVEAAAEAGQVTVTKTPIIVECSVIFSLSPGGVLPASRVVLDAASFAAGGNVSSRVSLPLQAGFYNHEPALYITPEVGVDPSSSFASLAQTVAQGFNSNFVPTAFTSLPGTNAADDIYVFTNFKQGNVLASAPIPAGPENTRQDYSPLWQINLVSWNSGHRPRLLTSQDEITNASKNGDVTIVPGATTRITVECSVIFTRQGGVLPGARIALDDPDTKANNR
ncbi:MAG TPA: hypothetical protein VGI46_12795 [Candidatus Acidoferrum sp.]|jgi:hypothetical protein